MRTLNQIRKDVEVTEQLVTHGSPRQRGEFNRNWLYRLRDEAIDNAEDDAQKASLIQQIDTVIARCW